MDKEPFVIVRKGDKKKIKKFDKGATYSMDAIEIANRIKDKRRAYAKGDVFEG